MDSYRHDSANITCGSKLAISEASSPEEKATHKRWARGVLAFYGALFALIGIAILAVQSDSDPNNQVAQASLQKNSLTQARQ